MAAPPGTNVPASLSARDDNVASLAAAAGSADAVSRGRAVAAGTLLVVMLGALGVGFRPVYRRAFAPNAALQAAAAGDARAARVVAARASPAVAAKLARLDELERAHRARNPLLYALAEGEAVAGAGAAPGADAGTTGAALR